jgi:hypothetical protein
MRKLAALGLSAAVVLSLAIAPSAQSAVLSAVKVSKPAAPTVVSISSSPVKKGKVNVTFAITLPTNTGGAKITGSKVSAGAKSCTITQTKTSCTIKGITNGKALNVIAQTKNKKGFGAKSVAVSYRAGTAAYPAVVVSAPIIPPAPGPPAPGPPAAPFSASWGYNSDGQLGDGSNADNIPVAVSTAGIVPSGKRITAISAGAYHTCAITDEATNNAYCWGQNSDGELGDNSITNRNIPVAVSTAGIVPSGKRITAISAGAYHTCAITDEATNNAYCWGQNSDGELGDNSITNRNIPVAVYTAGVLSTKRITAISAGRSHTFAITN